MYCFAKPLMDSKSPSNLQYEIWTRVCVYARASVFVLASNDCLFAIFTYFVLLDFSFFASFFFIWLLNNLSPMTTCMISVTCFFFVFLCTAQITSAHTYGDFGAICARVHNKLPSQICLFMAMDTNYSHNLFAFFHSSFITELYWNRICLLFTDHK